MKQIRRHLTYANVMSSFAVFLILGGATAFAAIKKVGANEIKANSIKTGKIVKEAVTAGKIKNAAIVEAKLADGAVTTNKLAKESVNAEKLAKESVTTEKLAKDAVTNAKLAADSVNSAKVAPNSLTGADLASDSVGASQFKNIIVVTANSATVANNATVGVTATCPAGSQAISGGFDGGGNATPWRVQRLIRDGNGWRAFGTNQTGGNSFLEAEAYCLIP